MSKPLTDLQQRYRTALYSYFRITNLPSVHELFMAVPSQPPLFTYSDALTRESILSRLDAIEADLAAVGDDDAHVQAFLRLRQQETTMLLQFSDLYSGYQPPDASTYRQYQLMQQELYGSLSPVLFAGILAHLRRLSKQQPARPVGIELEQLFGYAADALSVPSDELFLYYKETAKKAFPELYRIVSQISQTDMQDTDHKKLAFERALKAVGALTVGWEVKVLSYGNNVSVSKHHRKVLMSDQFTPRSLFRFKQVLLHEVGAHVQLSMHDDDDRVSALSQAIDEEGVAIMFEQLLSARYMHKRTMRYLALCLASGLDGHPRDFCETFAALTQAFELLGNTQSEAADRAFYETVRAFRGGFPAVAGAVYSKDKIYLESNLRVWQHLAKKPLTVADFQAVFLAPRQPPLEERNV